MGVNYDAGSARARRPFMRIALHWRFFWDYGNSEIGNQGITC